MCKNLISNFTLIKLMLIVATIGIVATISITYYYHDYYLIKTKVIEGLNLKKSAKMAVSKIITAKDHNQNLNKA